MSSRPEPETRLGHLHDRLWCAQVITPDLMSKLVAHIYGRGAMPNRAARLGQINRLIEVEAWTEAALVLIELGLPQWKLRRLIYEDGAWLCSFSKQWSVPDWLGDNAEARHEALPLAILSAMTEAQQYDAPACRAATSAPQCRAEPGSPVEIMCCDNFD